MAITIQLTEIPENEHVPTRIFTLSKKGGTFGSAFDCDIQLPDRSGQVGAKHGHFIAGKNKMIVEALNEQRISVNGVLLAFGRSSVIEDGAVIGVADYILLVSVIDEINKAPCRDENILSNEHISEPYFSLNADEDNLESKIAIKNFLIKDNQDENMPDEQSPHFSAKGVFSDDPFADDPFVDEDIALSTKTKQELHYEPIAQNNEFTNYDDKIAEQDADMLFLQKNTTVAISEYVENKQIDQLVTLVEKQLVSANEQQTKIFTALDETLATFLNEFSPQHLADIFDDFSRPFFVQKEKQYWRAYQKTFTRRLDKGEYHRLFKALLLENMQKNVHSKD